MPEHCLALSLVSGRDMSLVTGHWPVLFRSQLAPIWQRGRPYRDLGPGAESKLNCSHWELTGAQKLETAVILVRVAWAWGGNRSGHSKETSLGVRPAPYLRSVSWALLSRAAICKALICQTLDMTDKMSRAEGQGGPPGASLWIPTLHFRTQCAVWFSANSLICLTIMSNL